MPIKDKYLIFDAIYNGDSDTVIPLLKACVTSPISDNDLVTLDTALFLATFSDQPKIAKELLVFGARVHARHELHVLLGSAPEIYGALSDFTDTQASVGELAAAIGGRVASLLVKESLPEPPPQVKELVGPALIHIARNAMVNLQPSIIKWVRRHSLYAGDAFFAHTFDERMDHFALKAVITAASHLQQVETLSIAGLNLDKPLKTSNHPSVTEGASVHLLLQGTRTLIDDIEICQAGRRTNSSALQPSSTVESIRMGAFIMEGLARRNSGREPN